MKNSRKQRRVLIVSFWFPPTNVMGAVRVGKFAKYLNNYGWEPVVLTGSNMKMGRGTTANLPVELEESNIVRTPSFGIADLIMSRLGVDKKPSPRGDSQVSDWKTVVHNWLETSLRPVYHLPALKLIIVDPIGWYPFAVKRGLEIIKHYDIDVILSSYGPSTSHFIASRLHRKTGVHWVADFRDLWAQHPYYPKYQPFQLFEEQVEKQVLKRSTVLIAAAEPMATQMEIFHQKKVEVIHNGFDEEDYHEDVPLTPKFSITFTGHIKKQDAASLDMLFEAIAELQQEKCISANNFELRFYGSTLVGAVSGNTLLPLVKKLGIAELVKIYATIPYLECIKKQKESTVLLLLLTIENIAKGIYSGKVFEYIGAARPILAIAPKGDVVDLLLRKTGTGIVANEKDEIKLILSEWIDEFQERRCISSNYSPSREIINNYTRRELTRKLAGVLDEAADSPM